MYETRKIHVTVPETVYEYLRREKLFKKIDGIITEMLIEKYHIQEENEE